MLPNVDTPMTEDGWAIMVRAIRHLALVQAGGANDLNAGAVDADQIALQEFFDALSALRAEADPFPQYQLAADASSGSGSFSGFNVSEDSFAWASGAIATIILAQTEYDPGSLYNAATGAFTVATAGVYALSLGLNIQFSHDSGTSDLYIQGQFYKNASPIDSDFYALSRDIATGAFGAGRATVNKSIIANLAAGDVITVRGSYNATSTGVNFTQAGAGTFCATYLGT